MEHRSMAVDSARRAQLIAVDGVVGREIQRRAEDLRRKVRRRADVKAGISRWDASGVFYELRAAGKKALQLTPRTVLLLYAADLAFRVRWEIGPALAAGQTVIAAPYVDTAIAFGQAAGLSRKWLAELLRFAPPADARVSAGSAKKRKTAKGRAMNGFIEFATAAAKRLQQRTPARPSTDR
jgi:thymidylate kinase